MLCLSLCRERRDLVLLLIDLRLKVRRVHLLSGNISCIFLDLSVHLRRNRLNLVKRILLILLELRQLLLFIFKSSFLIGNCLNGLLEVLERLAVILRELLHLVRLIQK